MPTSTIPKDILELFPSIDTLSGITSSKLAERSYALTFTLPKKGNPGETLQFDLGPLGADVHYTIRLTRQKCVIIIAIRGTVTEKSADRVYWIFPSFSVPLPFNVDTQLLLLRLHDNTVAAILPLTTEQYTGSLRGSVAGNNVILRLERDVSTTPSPVLPKVVFIMGLNVKEVVSRAAEWLRTLQYGDSKLPTLASEEHIFSAGLT
jgi:hypothetical protein